MFTSSFMMPTYLSYMPLMYPQGASAPGFPTSSAATTTPTLLDVKASSSAPSPLPLPASIPASAPVTTSSICVSSLRMETPHEIQAKFLGACNCSSCSSVASSKESSCGSIDSKTGSAFSQIDDDLIKGRLSLGLGAKPESSGMYPGASLMSMGMGMGMGMGMPRGMPMSLPGLGMPMVSMFSVQSPYGLPMSYPGVASTPAVEVVPTRPLALDHTSASAVAVSHNSDENSNRPYTRKRNTTKRYHCSECPKKFHQRSNLITHVRTHTGEKPFACPFPDCQRRFSQSSNLRRHQRIHSRDFNGTSGSGSTSGSTTSVPISSLVSPSGKPSATISERSVSPNSEEDEHEHDSSDSERDENGLSAILEADEKVAASSLTNLGTSAAQTTVFAAAK